jgi:hypothetical protein
MQVHLACPQFMLICFPVTSIDFSRPKLSESTNILISFHSTNVNADVVDFSRPSRSRALVPLDKGQEPPEEQLINFTRPSRSQTPSAMHVPKLIPILCLLTILQT